MFKFWILFQFLLLLGFLKCNGSEIEVQEQLTQLKTDVEALKSSLQLLQNQVLGNIADQYASKVISSVQSNSQKSASKFWLKAQHYTQGSFADQDSLLASIIKGSYSGTRLNFYPLLEFILRNNLTSGFPHLYSEIEFHDHIYEGQEIFVFAAYLKSICGGDGGSTLWKKLPEVVTLLVSKPVIFKNKDNSGWVIASPVQDPCKTKQECFGTPKPEAFIHKITPNLTLQDVIHDNRSYWSFQPPVEMMNMNSSSLNFNGSRMAWGFHIKNIAEDKFLVVKMRLTSYFLRENVTFDSYYAGELQCQFMPMLVKGHEGKIKIGLRDKYIHKLEFVYGGDWGKKNLKVGLGRRAQHKEELDGKLWEVIQAPENEEMMEEVESDSSKSKCQF